MKYLFKITPGSFGERARRLATLAACCFFLLCASARAATTYYWIGGSPNEWNNGAHWSLSSGGAAASAVPGSGDTAIFDSGGNSNCNVDISPTVATLTLASTYGQTVTLGASKSITVTGNMTVAAGTFQTAAGTTSSITCNGTLNVGSAGALVIRHSSATGDGAGQTVTAGTLTIDAGGTLNANGKGFGAQSGPGAQTTNFGVGGTHGGVAGAGNTKATYGSFSNPTALGSGGDHGAGGTGGGAIVITSSGTVTVNGSLAANGTAGVGGGSGGSLNITAGTLAGTGTISANGGSGNTSYGMGGGGRVAVAAATFSFTGTLQAISSGTGYKGYAGTIYLGSSPTISIGGAGNMASLRLGSDDSSNYTFTTVTVNSGGTLSIDGNPNKNSPNGGAATLNIGTLTINANGLMTASTRGFQKGYGPSYNNDGGGHGGKSISANTCYGSITNPVYLGSASGYLSAGGAVIISSSGTVTVDGTLDANGETGDSLPRGAGGTINIRAASMAGSGSIKANGGTGLYGGAGGGGGRIAVALSSGSTFGPTFTAYGGPGGDGNGAAGTIYLEKASQGAGKGDLTIDNNSQATNSGVETFISSTVSNASVGAFSMANTAKLTIDSGQTLTTAGTGTTATIGSGTTLTNNGTLTLGGTTFTSSGTLTNGTGSLVRYNGQADDSAVTLLNTTYYHLYVANTGTTFNLPAVGTITVNGDLYIINGTLDVTGGSVGLNVKGNWRNDGSFTRQAGTVTLGGTAQSIIGTAPTTFYNLTKTSLGVPDTLTISSTVTTTVTNTLTLTGAAGQLLSLRSNSDGDYYHVNASGTRTMNFLDIKDFYNDAAANPINLMEKTVTETGHTFGILFPRCKGMMF